jgi:hypothetical protein
VLAKHPAGVLLPWLVAVFFIPEDGSSAFMLNGNTFQSD